MVDYIEVAQGKRIILRMIELQRREAVTLPCRMKPTDLPLKEVPFPYRTLYK